MESFRNDIPAGLAAVLKRMTAKNPDDRYRTPAAVAVALGPYTQAGVPAAAAAPARPVPAANVDDTPLPAALAAESPGRLPRAGTVRAATNDDTSA